MNQTQQKLENHVYKHAASGVVEALVEFRASQDLTTLLVTGIKRQKSSRRSELAATASYSFKILLISCPMLPCMEISKSAQVQPSPLGLPAAIRRNCCKSSKHSCWSTKWQRATEKRELLLSFVASSPTSSTKQLSNSAKSIILGKSDEIYV